MVFERYYIDVLNMLNSSFKKIASGNYDNKDVERLFELSKTDRYPGIFSEMAESFGKNWKKQRPSYKNIYKLL